MSIENKVTKAFTPAPLAQLRNVAEVLKRGLRQNEKKPTEKRLGKKYPIRLDSPRK